MEASSTQRVMVDGPEQPVNAGFFYVTYKEGQDRKEQRVTSGGFSSRRLTRVRDVLERYVDAGFVAGAVAVVARHGEVHIEATGALAFKGAGSGTPMAADTICRIGSMTKPVVAACR